MSASRDSRLEKSRPSMCCDAASVAKRGSRFVGLDSRRNVSEFGLVLALEEQEAQNEVMKQRSSEVTTKGIAWRLRPPFLFYGTQCGGLGAGGCEK